MANLFQQMCDNASVKCETIQGKAYGNFIKRYFTYFHLRHAWNSVYINNEWKLVDVTWDCYRAKTSAFKKDRELEWVFKNSKEFAKTHLPYNPAWQLLNDPYTKKEFWRQLEPSKKEYMFNDTLKNFINSRSVLASLSSIKCTYFYDNNRGRYITDLNKLGWNTIFNASDSVQVEDGLKVYEALNKAINTEGFEKYKKKYESTVSFIDEHKYVGLLSRK
jgi:transglutaminase/protease-like cytokinesis protein 3